MMLRRIFAITWKDLRDIYRTPSSLVLMLVAPLAVALILGAAFGGEGNFQLQTVKTAVVELRPGEGALNGGAQGNLATESPSAALVRVLRSRELSDLIDATVYDTAQEARAAVDDGKAAVAVIIPAGFDLAVTGTSGEKAAVELYQDPTVQIGPAIVAGVVEQVLGEYNGARAAATAAAALGTKAAAATGGGFDKIRAAAEEAARRYTAGTGAGSVDIEARGPRLAGSSASGQNDPGVIAVVLAGQLVFFILFGASTAARTILLEEQQGTLARLFTTPTPRSQVLGGKYVLSYLTVLVQTIVILVVGALAFGIDWGSWSTTVVLTLVGCAVASSLAMLIGALSHTLAQQGAIGSGIYLVLALLGGNFTGSVTLGGVAGVLHRLTPNGWLLEGWDAAMRGGDLSTIGLQVAVVLGFTVVFFVASVLVLRRRFA
jgi:ABC-2 type transport system permease protein